MTNKEAIFKLIEYCRWLERNFERFNAEPFDKAIGALEDKETREQYEQWEAVEEEEAREYFERIRQTCEDCISRQAALKQSRVEYNDDGEGHRVVYVEEIKALPPVTPQPKTGRWIADVDRWGDIVTTTDGYRCSECNTFNTDKDNYCPHCGCRMKGESE